MTVDDYAKLSGTRKYMQIGGRSKLATRPSASTFISICKNPETNTRLNTLSSRRENEEPELVSVRRDASLKTPMKPFGINKNEMGRVLVNETIDSN